MANSKSKFRLLLSILLLFGISAQSQFPSENFFYKLRAKHSGKNLDVKGQSTAIGGSVVQWPDDGNDQQKWLFVKASGNDYRIVSKISGLCLDVKGQSQANGGIVVQWVFDGNDQQVWTLEPTGVGNFFRLKSKHSGKYLDVLGKSTANGGNVGQWELDGNDQQVWELIKSDPVKMPPMQKDEEDPDSPKMVNHNKPKTLSMVTGIEWMPCIYVKDDPKYSSTPNMKIKESPWYYLERIVSFEIQNNNYWNNANNSTPIKTTASYKKSWTKSEEQSFSVTISAEAKAGSDNLGGSVTAGVSMTASIATSHSETSEKEVGTEVTILPKMSYSLFTRFEIYTLKRLDGSTVKSWKIGTTTAAASFPN